MGLGLTGQWQKTGKHCGRCTQEIVYTEEIYVVEIVKPHGAPSAPECLAVLTENGEYVFPPRLLHVFCWEKMAESILDETSDMPPVQDAASIFECKTCGSGIREWEQVCGVGFAEIHVSKRAPHGEHGPSLVRSGTTDLLCLHCLWIIGENSHLLWKEFEEACAECLHRRCDRTRSGHCPCRCHREG